MAQAATQPAIHTAPEAAASASFTRSDTPAIRKRIQDDLDVAIETVRVGDPHLRALVLTGGFARGEGAVRGGEPQNDYDLIALRGMGRPRIAYEALRMDLEQRLGIHIDLAPVAAARLPFVPRSIFWYETALRGRVVWGDPHVLRRIRLRRPLQIEGREAMRLLVNRAAGLVLATEQDDDGRRLQASKALLGAMDAWMLEQGVFPPSQTERWEAFGRMAASDGVPGRLMHLRPWLAWAYDHKTRPDKADAPKGQEAWQTAAKAVLEAVPAALQHAGIPSLEAYERQDSLLETLLYLRRSRGLPGARRVRHPTSRVRVATLRMLEASLEGGDLGQCIEPMGGPIARERPLSVLESLRRATLQ